MLLGTKVPWGGPWAPPPRGVQVPGDVNGFSCWFFAVVLVLFFVFLSWVIRLSGWCLYGNSALQDSTRVGIIVCVPLFFFVWCVRRRRLSLSLSLFLFSFSQALGKPKPPSRGFGVTLVFLHSDRDHTPRPVLQAPQLHPGHPPRLFFFHSCVVRAGLWSGCFWVFGSRGGWFWVGLCFSWVFSLALVLRLLLSCILHVLILH